MHITDDLGSVYTPTSVWSIDYSKNETIARMRCLIGHRLFDGLTCLVITRITTVHISISHIIVVGRTNLSSVHLTLRYAPFPFASHPTVFSDAVKVKLTTIDCRSRNLTCIALQFDRAHDFDYIEPDILALSFITDSFLFHFIDKGFSISEIVHPSAIQKATLSRQADFPNQESIFS